MATYNIGACDCCGEVTVCDACEEALPSTLHITFTGGDCDCLALGTPYTLTYAGGFWGYSEATCGAGEWNGFLDGSPGFFIAMFCSGGVIFLEVGWRQHDVGTDYGYFADAFVTPGTGDDTCDPVYLSFSGFTGTAVPTACATTLPTSAVVTL